MRPHTSKLFLFSLAAASAMLLTASLFSSQSQSLSKVETPLQVAEAMDCIIQPRFQKDAGEFGTARIVRVRGHEHGVGYFTVNDKHEKQLMDKVHKSEREVIVAFLHCTHKPGKYAGQNTPSIPAQSVSKGKIEFHPYMTPLFEVNSHQAPDKDGISRNRGGLLIREAKGDGEMGSLYKVATEALPRLQQGKPAESNSGKWLVVMRPVRAAQESCLKCHVNAKPSDTLGVMVYAVSKVKTGA